jgi:preprotein translocase SecE subunit
MFNRAKTWFVEVIQEMRRVNWPTRHNLFAHTGIVIISVSISMLILAAYDYGLSYLVRIFLIKTP